MIFSFHLCLLIIKYEDLRLKNNKVWTPYFARCVFTRWRTRFLFVKKIIFRKDLESPLILVLFLKGKQNKKENLKCDFLFGKDSL